MGVSKSTKIHNKELARVRKIAKRLEGQGYVLNIGKDISNLSTRQLKKIHSGHDLVSRNIYHFGEEASEKLRKEQIKKRLIKLERQAHASGYQVNRHLILAADNRLRNASISKLKKWGYISTRKRYSREKDPHERDYGRSINISMLSRGQYDSSGEHIPRNNVYQGSEATIKIDMLLSIAEYGSNYRGIKGDPSSDEMINKNGKRLENIITKARMKHTDEEIVESINKNWLKKDSSDGVTQLAKDLERIVLAVYDEVYASWGSDPGEFDQKLRDIEDVLDCED